MNNNRCFNVKLIFVFTKVIAKNKISIGTIQAEIYTKFSKNKGSILNLLLQINYKISSINHRIIKNKIVIKTDLVWFFLFDFNNIKNIIVTIISGTNNKDIFCIILFILISYFL